MKKGDRVAIYMPMIPEAAVAMLACARIGAIHSVVFGGFSPDALAGRIQDCDCKVRDHRRRRPARRRKHPAEDQCRRGAGARARRVETVHRGASAPAARSRWIAGRDLWYHELMARPSARLPAASRWSAEDPLFILYTSGSTGKPKGVLHTTGGYLVYAALTHELRVRLSRRRRLLVHGRRRLGHRPQLHRLRPAGQRRDHADVRGRAELPGRRAASGRWSTSTRSTSSTPRRPRSAR